LETLYKLKDQKLQKLLEEIVQICAKIVPTPFRLILFGSFARGDATQFSDIDIALQTKEDIDEKVVRKIQQELQKTRTLRKIDCVYLNRASPALRETVKKEGVLLYESAK